MGSSIFFGGSVVAAVLAGMISLFAPCCVSVMLPAYFAASFHNKRFRVVMTFVFAAGIATVILPAAILIRRRFSKKHVSYFLGCAFYRATRWQLRPIVLPLSESPITSFGYCGGTSRITARPVPLKSP